MGDKTGIEWTEATWNPVTGCDEVSPGCDHCYAKTLAERFRGTAGHYYEQGFDVVLRPDKLDQPLRWKRGRRIFVNSMSDLFHKDVPDTYIAQVFGVMALAPQHTFQLLTKRHGRMRSLLNNPAFYRLVRESLFNDHRLSETDAFGTERFPLPNVWLGVSVEDQPRADLRVTALLQTPAAVRFLSCEPLLGPVELPSLAGLCQICGGTGKTAREVHISGGKVGTTDCYVCRATGHAGAPIDWVIVGGESGRGARPMEPVWARYLRDQCAAYGVPFLFKQWGEHAPRCTLALCGTPCSCDGVNASHPIEMRRVGKKAAGRQLDGTTHDGYPHGGDA